MAGDLGYDGHGQVALAQALPVEAVKPPFIMENQGQKDNYRTTSERLSRHRPVHGLGQGAQKVLKLEDMERLQQLHILPKNELSLPTESTIWG